MNLNDVIARLPEIAEKSASVRDMLLANLAMIGEIPAPTFSERERARFVAERFVEAGLLDSVVDDYDNAIGVIPGSGPTPRGNILLVTNVDTIVSDIKDQTIEIQPERAIGPFVGDNSLALATLVTLPALLEQLGLRIQSNVVMVAAARNLGRGNLEGIRHFLTANALPFAGGICLESVQLGRLNYTSVGVLRGDIVCRLPSNFDWSQYGATGTITPMSEVVRRIRGIPIPQRPLTTVILGSIHGGIAHNNIARETTLRFEARSESAEMIQQLREQLEDLTQDVSAQSGTEITLDIFSERQPGGLDISHALVRSARAILTALGITPMLYATTSLLAALRDANIPAVTIGLTTGERKSDLDEIDEAIALPPLAQGLAQLTGLLLAADEKEPA